MALSYRCAAGIWRPAQAMRAWLSVYLGKGWTVTAIASDETSSLITVTTPRGITVQTECAPAPSDVNHRDHQNERWMRGVVPTILLDAPGMYKIVKVPAATIDHRVLAQEILTPDGTPVRALTWRQIEYVSGAVRRYGGECRMLLRPLWQRRREGGKWVPGDLHFVLFTESTHGKFEVTIDTQGYPTTVNG